jgi:hypothetical protein
MTVFICRCALDGKKALVVDALIVTICCWCETIIRGNKISVLMPATSWTGSVGTGQPSSMNAEVLGAQVTAAAAAVCSHSCISGHEKHIDSASSQLGVPLLALDTVLVSVQTQR